MAAAAARPIGGHATSASPSRRTGSSAGPPSHARDAAPKASHAIRACLDAAARSADGPRVGRRLPRPARRRGRTGPARVTGRRSPPARRARRPTLRALVASVLGPTSTPAPRSNRCRRRRVRLVAVESGAGHAAGTRARACAGSAYSRGLTIQYSPDDGPYQDAPLQVASFGSRASSYEVEPIVALRHVTPAARIARRRGCRPRRTRLTRRACWAGPPLPRRPRRRQTRPGAAGCPRRPLLGTSGLVRAPRARAPDRRATAPRRRRRRAACGAGRRRPDRFSCS